ncbi:hypothetical protein ACFWIQ_09680 [Kitasatospora sp. NPDC127059]|uniref:hypothetical protein n=1 Tax=unclassified Kitasatospora TaxID=2633591 RepID=UPI00364DC3A4
MQFTSGGTDGPRFDQDGYDLDLGNNVGGFLHSALSAPDVAQAFYAAGWRVRKSSWTEFEVEHAYAELELFPATPVRFRGVVVPERIDELLSAFTTLGLSYTVELEDQDGGETIYRS